MAKIFHGAVKIEEEEDKAASQEIKYEKILLRSDKAKWGRERESPLEMKHINLIEECS